MTEHDRGVVLCQCAGCKSTRYSISIANTQEMVTGSPVLAVANEAMPANTIQFSQSGVETIRIEADGRFFYHGRLVTTDMEIYNAMVSFFKATGHYHE